MHNEVIAWSEKIVIIDEMPLNEMGNVDHAISKILGRRPRHLVQSGLTGAV